MEFLNKYVLIVGGTSGIGFETACRFAKQGAQVAVTGREEKKTVDAASLIAEQAGNGAEVLPLAGDASDEKAMQRIVDAFVNRFDRLDVLAHVAGISGRRWGDGPLDQCTPEGWDTVMTSNVRSVYASNHFALRQMVKQKSGAIVNVSSILGQLGAQDHFVTHAYAASRGAVISLTRSAAVYFAKHNIRMNVVCPGLLDTPMSQRAVNDTVVREALSYYQPLAPHIGYPDDVAEAILYLASERAKFVTGISFNIDGGWTAQ